MQCPPATPKTLIHIGLAKCASSSVQRFLDGNRERLQGASIFYSDTGRPRRGTSHSNIANEILERKYFDPKLGTLADVADIRRRHPDGLIVLSSEIFERAHKIHIERLRNALPGDNVRVYLIIRNLISRVRSSYAQKIGHGRHKYDFDQFFRSRMREEGVNYFNIARRWAAVFGWENMVIRVLDRAHLLNGDLFDDLLDIVGLDPGSAWTSLELERTGIFNPSPGWKVLEAVRALYTGQHGMSDHHPLVKRASLPKEIEGLGPCSLAVGRQCDWNTDLGQYLTREQADRCSQIYSRAIEKINRHLGQKLPPPPDLQSLGFIEREFLPEAARICPTELSSFYDELWNRLQERRRKARPALPTPSLSRP